MVELIKNRIAMVEIDVEDVERVINDYGTMYENMYGNVIGSGKYSVYMLVFEDGFIDEFYLSVGGLIERFELVD